MNYSINHSQLTVPLVGTLPQELESKAVAVPHDDAAAAATDQDELEQDEPISCCEHVMSVVLYFLLFMQFGIFFYVGDDSVGDLQWSVVNWSIALFIVATHLYRNAMAELGVSYDAAMLLPEIVIVVSMAMAYFYHIIAAFLLLVVAKLCMALTVIAVNTYQLCYCEESDEEEKGCCLLV